MDNTQSLLPPEDQKVQAISVIDEQVLSEEEALFKILSELENKDLVLKSHSEGIRCSDISWSGLKAVTGSDDETAIVWDIEKFSEETIVSGFNSPVVAVSFSPDENFFAAGCENGFTKVWQMSSKSFISTLGDQMPITSLAFSNNSTNLSIGVKDGIIKIWNFLDKKQVFSLFGHKKAVILTVFLKSQSLLSCSTDGTVKIWDLEMKKLVKSLEVSNSAITSTTISPSGNSYALGLQDGRIKLNKFQNRTIDRVLILHQSPVLCVSFSSSGRYILSSSDDSINIYDILRKTSRSLFGHNRLVTSVKFIKNDLFIWSTSLDKTIRVWVLGEVRAANTIRGNKGPVHTLACSSQKKILATGSSDCSIRLWNLKDCKKVRKLKGHSRAISALLFTFDDFSLVSAGLDSVIKVWSMSNFNVLFTLTGHLEPVKGIVVNKQGKMLVSCSEDSTIRIWDLACRSEEQVFAKLSSPAEAIKLSEKSQKIFAITTQGLFISFDIQSKSSNSLKIGGSKSLDYCSKSNQAVIGSSSGRVTILNPETLKVYSNFQGHEEAISSVLLRKAGKLLLTGSFDCSIKMFQVSSKQEIFKFTGHGKPVLSLALSSDEETIYSSSGDFSIKTWIIKDKEPEFVSDSFQTQVLCAGINKVNNEIAIGLQSSEIVLMDFQVKSIKFKFVGHLDAVVTVNFSYDGKILASGARDYYVKVWDMAGRKIIATLKGHSDFISKVLFCFNESLLTSSFDKTLRFWNISENLETKVLRGFSGKINDFLVTRSEKEAIACCSDKTLQICDISEGKINEQLWKFDSEPLSLDQNNDSSFICITFENSVKLLKMGKKKELITFNIKKLSTATFTHCGLYLIAGKKDGRIRVFNLNERRSEFTLNSHKAKVNKILSCPGSRAFFSVSDDGYLKYWPLNKRKQMDDDSFASFRKFHDFSEEDQDSEYFSLLNPDYQNYSGYLGTICKLKDKNYSCIGRDGLTLLISFYSFTALHILAYLGESNGLKELKSQKPVPLIANSFGNSPLFFSINRNHQKTTDRLLKLIIRSQKHLKIFLTSLHGIRNNLCMIIQNSSKYLAPLFHSFGRMKNDFKGLDLSGVKPKFSYFSSLSFENYGYSKEKSPDKRVKVFFSRIRTPTFAASDEGLKWMQSLIQCDNKKLMKCEVIQYFITEKWNQIYLLVYAQSFILLLVLVLPVFIMQSQDHCCIIYYSIIILFMIIWEVFKVNLEGRFYFQKMSNCLSTLALFSNLIWISFLLTDEIFYWLNIYLLAVNFLRGLAIFNVSSHLRMNLRLIFMSLNATKGYFFLLLYFILAFGLILSMNTDGKFAFDNLFDLPLRVISGELSEYQIGGDYLKDFMFFLCIFCNILVFGNLFIPVLIETYSDFRKNYQVFYYEDLAKIIYEIGKIKSVLKYKNKFKFLMVVDKADEMKYLGRKFIDKSSS